MAKIIYHIHRSSNSYNCSEWYDTDYYLCETEEEYQQLMAEYQAKRKKIEDDYANADGKPDWSLRWRYNNFHFTPEQKVHASEYYYGHEWQGKTFDAIGFCWYERLERSSHTKYYLKPGSVGAITPCKDPGIGWMYGS